MATMGRPSKRTNSAESVILAMVKTGSSLRAAAERTKVSKGTLMRWLRRGRAGEPQFKSFARRVDRALAERQPLGDISDTPPPDWPPALADFLRAEPPPGGG